MHDTQATKSVSLFLWKNNKPMFVWKENCGFEDAENMNVFAYEKAEFATS